MAKNLRALTDEELEYMNDKYEFEVFNNQYIVVKTKGYNRTTLHPIDQQFALSSSIRKVTISVQAIKLWIDKYMGKCSLIDVQNAISTLIVTYQDVNETTIDECINKKSTKIKEV